MYLKIHKSYRTVVAVCDSELIGKKFEQDIYQLDVRESFYKGDLLTEDQVVHTLKKYVIEDATFNIIGSKSVKAAEKAGIIKSEEVSRIQDIPFTLILI